MDSDIQNKNIKIYIKKNGETKQYIYNQTIYNKKCYEKNKDKILNNYYECLICDKKILKSNKSNHEKTKYHILSSKIKCCNCCDYKKDE